MSSINIHLRFPELNSFCSVRFSPQYQNHQKFSKQYDNTLKIHVLTREGNLIYCDDGDDFKAHLKTIGKFSVLTITSPLIVVARLIRSIAFPFATGDINRAGREFIGAPAVPVVTAYCLLGSLLSSAVYVLSSGKISFYANMRRTYACFEAWINRIDLNDRSLETYSHRVSAPMDWIGTSATNRYAHVWTTAPCMQPLLENGFSSKGGLLDAERLRKIYPFIPIDGVRLENGRVVIQSHNIDKEIHYTACNGAFEHSRTSSTCCCCFRIETAYDRVLCCEVGRGSCSSLNNPGDSCGIVSCGVCGSVGACCCYVRENDELTLLNAGCFGPQGPSCITVGDFTQIT